MKIINDKVLKQICDNIITAIADPLACGNDEFIPVTTKELDKIVDCISYAIGDYCVGCNPDMEKEDIWNVDIFDYSESDQCYVGVYHIEFLICDKNE